MEKIILAPNPILSSPAKPVFKIGSGVLKIIEDMRKILDAAKDPEGVGLAAPQIGKPLRIFIVKPTLKSKALAFLNPKILKIDKPSKSFTKERKVGSKKRLQKLEGCLSLKDIWGTVLRAPTVEISYLDENGKMHKKLFKDFLATIIQHEYDHLEGILFPRRVLEQKGKLYKSSKDEKGEDVFEEMEI